MVIDSTTEMNTEGHAAAGGERHRGQRGFGDRLFCSHCGADALSSDWSGDVACVICSRAPDEDVVENPEAVITRNIVNSGTIWIVGCDLNRTSPAFLGAREDAAQLVLFKPLRIGTAAEWRITCPLCERTQWQGYKGLRSRSAREIDLYIWRFECPVTARYQRHTLTIISDAEGAPDRWYARHTKGQDDDYALNGDEGTLK